MDYPRVKMCNCGSLPRHAHIWLGSHIKMGTAFSTQSKGVLRVIDWYKKKLITRAVVDSLCRQICLLNLPKSTRKDIRFNH